MCSQAKRQANRRNAQKSTGPKSPEGKARSSLNAVTHAAYCKTLLFTGESKEHFEEVRQCLLDTIEPRDAVELTHFERLLAAKWKLYRIAPQLRNLNDPTALAAMKELHESERVQQVEWELNGGRRSRSSWHALTNVETLALQEQRLENQFHKALRELRQWRAAKAKEAKMKNEANEEETLDVAAAETRVSERTADRRSEDPDSSPDEPQMSENVSLCPAEISDSQNEPNADATEASPSPAATHFPSDPGLTRPQPSALHASDRGSA